MTEIDSYLREHGATYTTEALRKQLIAAGHNPAEVDAALRETEVTRAPELSVTRTRRSRFWWLAIGLHLAALVIATVWVLQGRQAPYAGFAAVILGVLLLIGLGISGLIGRSMLGSGTGVALVVPAISAILIGGTCMAVAGGPVTPPRNGTMELEILAPRSFVGTGAAVCSQVDSGPEFSVSSEHLGMLDGQVVTVTVDSFDVRGPNASAFDPSVNVYITIGLGTETEPPEAYITYVNTRLDVEVAAPGFSGTVGFEDLAREPIERPPGETIPEPISGSISWTCE